MSQKQIKNLNEQKIFEVDTKPYLLLEGKKFYLKKVNMEALTNELLSKIIARHISLTTPELEIAFHSQNGLYLLSEDFKKSEFQYRNGYQNSPDALGIHVSYHSIQEYEKLYAQAGIPLDPVFLLQLLKMSVYDGFRREQDRSANNYFFVEKCSSEMILLDHSDSFVEEGNFIKNEQFTLRKESNSIVPYLRKYQELRDIVLQLSTLDPEVYFQELEKEYPILISDTQKQISLKLMKDSQTVFHRWLNKM